MRLGNPIPILIALGAYAAVLGQVGVLGSWPLLGGQPHLIALGAVVFLVGGRMDLGAIWMLVGGGLIDLLLPVRFGSTLLPLLVTYGLLTVLLTRSVETPNWIGTLVGGLILLVGTELPLVIITGAWVQLRNDLLAGTLILIPIARYLMHRLELRRHGLVVR